MNKTNNICASFIKDWGMVIVNDLAWEFSVESIAMDGSQRSCDIKFHGSFESALEDAVSR